MPREKPEQAERIIPRLREVEVELGRWKTVAEAVKKIGATEQTNYRWKKKFGGLWIDRAKRLKELKKKNSRLLPAGEMLAKVPLTVLPSLTAAAASLTPRNSESRRGDLDGFRCALLSWSGPTRDDRVDRGRWVDRGRRVVRRHLRRRQVGLNPCGTPCRPPCCLPRRHSGRREHSTES